MATQISVHIVTYNSAAHIEMCLDSLLNQQSVEFGVLVVDNASSDDTVAQVEKKGVEVVVNPDNRGYSAAHNLAIGRTQSEYVLTLNPDVWLAPDYLAKMVAVLDENPQLGSAAGRLLRVEKLGETPQLIDSTGLLMSRSRRQLLRNCGDPVAQTPMQGDRVFGPDGAAAVYRRAMLEDIAIEGEIFDEDFFMHKEDVDVCWRAQLRGWQSAYVPEAVGHHIRGFRPGHRERVSADMRFLGVRNRYLLMMKNEITPHFWRDAPAILWYDLKILGFILLKERASLRAFGSAWQLRRRMMSKRRIIQAGRKVEWQQLCGWF
ncbi:MAG: glycosyltransferase family 2 protein [Chloroflexi bacterium]|nr:glycosyltransferase family 2 protein [Chloroflexota bacterium]